MIENPLPAYSVLMAVYLRDDPAALQQAIDSILCQTVPSDDFVIVCDGPLTSELEALLERYAAEHDEIHVHKIAENQGLGRALAAGVLLCSHDLIARMDSDDVAVEGRSKLELNAFAEDASLDIVSGAILEFDRDVSDGASMRKLPKGHSDIERFARRRNPFNHVAVMFKKSSVLKVGNYQDFDRLEDYYLWVRMLQGGCRARNLAEVLVFVRVGNGMQERRRGKAYLRSQLKFQKYLLNARFISFPEFVRNSAERSAAALMPTRLRSRLYKMLLRKRGKRA